MRMWEPEGSSQSGMVPTGPYSVLYRIRTVIVDPDGTPYWSGFPELVTAMVNTGSCQVNNINVGCYSL